jgi:3-oxoacyl-[acyl-carrier protein] reductase
LNRFEGRVALVTGGSSGIGAAVAERLLREGAKVATLDLAAGGPAGSLTLPGDVRISREIESAVGQAEKELGPLSVLVCSAGITGESLRTVEVSDDEWRRVLAINADGTFFANRAVLPGMTARNYGRIVNIASIAGKEGNPNAPAYSASKAAVIGLTKSLGKELADTDIAVNCVTPAAARTRIFDQMTQEHIAYMLSKIPRGRFVEVEEIASLIAWLASPENSFSTGAVFDISGGRATY